MNELIDQLLKDFIRYISANRMVDMINELVNSVGIHVQDACRWLEIEIMDYLSAEEYIEENSDRFEVYYKMLQEEPVLQKARVWCDYRTED